MSAPLAIAIDLGGTQLRAALVAGARVEARAAEPTDVAGGPEAVLAQMQRLIGAVSAGSPPEAIGGIGISAPGPLDSEAGVVLEIPTLPGWTDFPLRDRLAAATGLSVLLENDGISAAYGEWRHGAGRGLSHLVYATVSTGLGGGVIVDGRIMHGRRGMAGHIGHFTMAPDGPRCPCGTIGCFEAFASGSALGRRARAAAAAHPLSALGRAATTGAVDARHVVEAARAGDEVALALIDDEAALLGRGFASLVHLYSPERVVMGGGVSAAFDLMEETIHRVMRANLMAAFRDVVVVRAALAENAGLVGAAALVADRPAS
ncbi:ROK family protein [Kaistia geumhonensis]|uniref:Glucokinase n=1 Tax=Kaistia geumhonensis TaxID=410839 RepID=A0ABU0M1B5_9HYPH|nr:ROK family protein [Kaistia geumhonensis]MCX5480027.1 ROK family protein [Kaistia geumhonensis]MDQ0514745.1 glucokinase [Kaistia geumhonensis]